MKKNWRRNIRQKEGNKGYTPIEERLAADTKRGSDDECWPWTGRNNSQGYGVVRWKGQSMTAHRMTWLVMKGEIPEGLDCAHRCHNRLCVNPSHLYLATRSQNMLDSSNAGRRLGPEKGKFHIGRPKKERGDATCRPLTATSNAALNKFDPSRLAAVHARFWPKVKITEPHLCWEWQAAKTPDGYGDIKMENDNLELAHRVAYEICCGEIPEGLFVCHHCDNPSCVNPKHLFIGTNTDNMRDASRKGRLHGNWNSIRPVGEDNPASKLTADHVRAIKHYLCRGESCKFIAKRYGVAPSTIERIANGQHWKHIE